MKGRREELQQFAEKHGLGVDWYAPGDGVARYRFWRRRDQRNPERTNYFSAARALVTVLGLGAAEEWVLAYSLGYRDRGEQ